jgi:hypothetical protein
VKIYKYLYYTFCNVLITLSVTIAWKDHPLPFIIFISIVGCIIVFFLTELLVSYIEGD